jgi:hypothetical protein
LPADSPVKFTFRDFDFDLDADFELGEDGYLDPIVYSAKIRFGESELTHDNFILGFFMHQWVKYTIIIVENSAQFIGQFMFTHMLGPILDEMMNHYRIQLHLASPLLGQGTVAPFTFDYRSVRSPDIQDGYVDLHILGELFHNNYQCDLQPDPMNFINSAVFSQLVVSESAATCIANQMARSQIGRVYLT